MAEGLAGGFPIATTSQATLPTRSLGGITVGEIYLFVILASVFVCTMAIQGAATRMMFSMGRDRPPARPGGCWGRVNTPVQDPGERRIAVGVLAAIPILRDRARSAGSPLSIAATGLIYLSYFLCNLGVMRSPDAAAGRTPRRGSASGAGASSINILALI